MSQSSASQMYLVPQLHKGYLLVVTQRAGKYGTFPCPFCEAVAAWKYSSSSGWCDGCGAAWNLTDGYCNITKGRNELSFVEAELYKDGAERPPQSCGTYSPDSDDVF